MRKERKIIQERMAEILKQQTAEDVFGAGFVFNESLEDKWWALYDKLASTYGLTADEMQARECAVHYGTYGF